MLDVEHNSNMDVDSARKILGVREGDGEAEIDRSFKERALEKHPDKGGTDEEFQELVMARDIVREATLEMRHKSEMAYEIERIQTDSLRAQIAENRRRVAKEEISPIVNNSLQMWISPLRKQRNQYTTLSFFSGILTGIIVYLKPDIKDFLSDNYLGLLSFGEDVNVWILVGIMFTAFLAAYAYLMQNKIQSMEETIKAFEDAFSNPTECASFLKSLLLEKNDSQLTQDAFTQSELVESLNNLMEESAVKTAHGIPFDSVYVAAGAIPRSVPRMCELIGSHEVVHLLIIRSIEHGFIRRSAPDGSLKVQYELLTKAEPD